MPEFPHNFKARDNGKLCGINIATLGSPMAFCMRPLDDPVHKPVVIAEVLIAAGDLKAGDYVRFHPPSVVHSCPVYASGLTGCCHKPVFELRHFDRLTMDEKLVTCDGEDVLWT